MTFEGSGKILLSPKATKTNQDKRLKGMPNSYRGRKAGFQGGLALCVL